MQNKTIFYFHFDILARDKMQLDGKFVLFPAVVEYP